MSVYQLEKQQYHKDLLRLIIITAVLLFHEMLMEQIFIVEYFNSAD
jgi:cell division protein ZapA (FtsZ GTPase activity inhibitor)